MRANATLRALLLGLGLVAAAPREAAAFCGFYVGGADQKLYNNATMVVLMREGTRTVLSMANNYQGPPADFAMVVPVPVVLQKENVKTLPRDLFDHLEALAAPRLVEYWEQDPCPPPVPPAQEMPSVLAMPSAAAESAAVRMDGRVRVEARFSVGEYEVVILSASDALALDTWLKQNQYQIPAGAEPILRPYVQAGMKFFVAKVDVSKVKMENGMAMLSPLRFHYDSETFSLPVRLGLLNSAGTQDLLVHILARGKRYQVANYPNVEIPTNYDVSEAARDSFGAFYAALFDRTVARKPGAVVTEYAWDASTCDPCPTPALEPSSVATLGADALAVGANGQPMGPLKGAVQLGDVLTGDKLPGAAQVLAGARATLAACYEKIGREGSLDVDLHLAVDKKGNVGAVKTTGPKGLELAFQDCVASTTRQLRFAAPTGGAAQVKVRLGFLAQRLPAAAPVINPYGFVLTRLHARYGKDALGQDLVFREAPPIAGGREEPGRPEQKHDAEAAGVNNFQARYAIRHPWKGPIACEHPQRGMWGGPPSGEAGDTSAKPALKVAFAPRGQIDLTAILEGGPPDLRTPAAVPGPAAVEATAAGCACEAASGERPGGGAGIAAALLGLSAARRRRRARG